MRMIGLHNHSHLPGLIRRLATASALCLVFFAPACAFAATGNVTLSDPVPTLLDGPRVTTEVNRLAAGARPVEGVAADGTSRIVIAVGARTAGQPIHFALYNDRPAPSASTAEDGALAAVGTRDFDHSQLTVSAVTTDRGPMAFAIYRAPLDFARPGSNDGGAAQRAVTVHWQNTATSQTGTMNISILRPPVMLVHGLWGSPADWDDFKPLIADPRFSVHRADYAYKVGDALKSTDPSYDLWIADAMRANALGYLYNAGQVAAQIESVINTFKRGHNPAGIAVAAVEADVVAHSMGGDVTRTMPFVNGFGSATTFGQGNVHKLITVDTPHLGSPLATDLLKDSNTCLRTEFARMGMYAIRSAVTKARIHLTGAIGDLSGDGAGGNLSQALKRLQSNSTQKMQISHLLPTAYLAGVMSRKQLDGLNDPPTAIDVLRWWCEGNPLADNLTASDWPGVMGGKSDAIVPLTSEVNNGTAYSTVTSIHSQGTAQLGFLPPGALQAKTGNPATAIKLLNTWVAAPAFTGLR